MEFVLVMPVFAALLMSSIQMGIVFFANAGLSNAVAEAAREATLWPRRNESELRARLQERRFGINPEQMTSPVFTYGRVGTQDFVEIRASYTLNLNFGLFTVPGVVLSESRRAWLP